MSSQRFHDEVRLFTIDGLHMVGDLITGSIIGLDDDGKSFAMRFFDHKQVDIESNALTDDQNLLKYEFEDCGFFEKEEREPLKSAYVHLTDKCNLNCLGCYSFVDDRNFKQDLTFEDVRHTLTQLKINGVDKIVFSGGEPFIRADFHDICKLAKQEIGFSNVSVITNGTLSFSKYQKALSYLDEIAVSIDGYDAHSHFVRDKGIMPKVIETIDCLKKHVKVSLISTLHAQNIHHMSDYQNFANERGLYLSYSILSVSPFEDVFKDYLFQQEDFIKIHNNIKALDYKAGLMDTPIDSMNFGCKGKCGVCSDVVSIGADGSIYPCHMMHDDALSLGNIKTHQLSDAIQEFNQHAIHIDQIEDCASCEYKYLCAGGCRGRSYYYHGSLLRKDPYCPLFKAHFKELIDHVKSQI